MTRYALSSLLLQHLLPSTAASVYTAPGRVEFTRISFTNTHTADVVVTLYHRPAAVTDTPSAVHTVFMSSITKTTTETPREDLTGITLSAGDELWAKAATADKVALTLYGVPLNIAPGADNG